jgi:hypothetical protein
MFLSEIAEQNLLNRKDVRSIRNWCKQKHLAVYKDTCGDYVIKSEFEFVYNHPAIANLKAQYGADWENYYSHYQNGEIHKIVELVSSVPFPNARYIPQGRTANSYKNK